MSAVDMQLCTQRLVAEVLDSHRGVDDRLAFQRKGAFDISVRDALHHLETDHGCMYRIRQEAALTPHIEQIGESVIFHIAHAKEQDFDQRFVNKKRSANSHHSVQQSQSCEGMTVSVQKLPMPLLCPDLSWEWIFKSEEYSLRVCVQPALPNTSTVVHLYIAGVHVATDFIATPMEDRILHIDAIHNRNGIPTFVDVVDRQGATTFGRLFLDVTVIHTWYQSLIVMQLFQAARPWASVLQGLWAYTSDVQTWIDVVKTADDAILRLVNIDNVVKLRAMDSTICHRGLAILRRMQSNGSSSSLDWKASIINEFAVERFEVLPISADVMKRLFEMQMFHNYPNASPYGLIVGHGATRSLCIPMHSSSSSITMAVASLLNVSMAQVDDPLLDEYLFEWNTTFEEDLVQCDPDESMTPYRVHLNEDGIQLTRDHQIEKALSSSAIPIDAVVVSDIRLDPRRTRRIKLSQVFPILCERLELQHSTIESCIREIQCRRVVKTWSLEGFDTGGNLSSLGMATLLAILLAGWGGAMVRVFMGKGRCAHAAFWDGTKMCLIDVCSSTKNTFDMTPYVSKIREASEEECVKKGYLVEVRGKSTWHVAHVVEVERLSNRATVQFLCNERKTSINLDSRAYRRLQKNQESDLDKIVKKLLLHYNKTSGSSFIV